MRHETTGRRSRNRSNNGRGGNGNGHRNNQNRVHVFDSNGPDVRIRGTAKQVHEKYVALSQDASAVGASVLAESYFQHAEHYQRVINGWQDVLDGKVPLDTQVSQKEIAVDSIVDKDEDLSLPASIVAPAKTEKVDSDAKLEDA